MKLVAVLLAVLLLSGCAMPGDAEEPPVDATLAASPLVIPAAELVPPMITEEDVLHSYDRAVEAWSWFELQPLAHEATGVELDGEIYWQVRSPVFHTLEDLRSHLLDLFSPELTDALLDQEAERPLYREHEGVLYVRSGGRLRDESKGARQITVEMENDVRYSVNITVDVLEDSPGAAPGLEFWTFPFELRDGRWVFTDFQLID